MKQRISIITDNGHYSALDLRSRRSFHGSISSERGDLVIIEKDRLSKMLRGLLQNEDVDSSSNPNESERISLNFKPKQEMKLLSLPKVKALESERHSRLSASWESNQRGSLNFKPKRYSRLSASWESNRESLLNSMITFDSRDAMHHQEKTFESPKAESEKKTVERERVRSCAIS